MSRTPTILIVEDERNNHLLFRQAFSDVGFEVVICQNADGDFLTEVKDVAPDIISMDLMIGKENGGTTERDGFQAMEVLKADEATKDIPVIVLTNFYEEQRMDRAKALGALDYITLQGQAMPKIAECFMRCVKDTKHYRPSNTRFAK